jgi:hypothetical protein
MICGGWAGGGVRKRLRGGLALCAAAVLAAGASGGRGGDTVPALAGGNRAPATGGEGIRYVGKPPPARPLAHALASWCGAGAVASANRPDTSLSSANLIHVTYAVPADGADRFANHADAIKTDVDAIGAWWAGQDPSRAPRFDLADFPGCSDLDLTLFRLPSPGASYTDPAGRVFQMAADMAALGPANVKNLVYYDGPVPSNLRFICGTSAGLAPLTGGVPGGFTFVWLGSSCPNDLGQGGLLALVAAHETGHDLGAVLPGAPHECASSRGHVCDSRLDLMFSTSGPGSTLQTAVLDVGRDDYYGFLAAQRVASQFDVQTSGWLAGLPRFPLSITVGGRGSVDLAAPAGTRSCAASCSIALENGTPLTLTAKAAADSRLVGWGESCAGTTPTCQLTADAAKNVTAQFGALSYLVRVTVAGKGKVTSTPAGISCPRACRTSFTTDTTLQARAAKGYRFTGWTGACVGRRGCKLVPGADRAVRATFRRRSA